MNNKEPLLKIRFEGPDVGPGRIPVTHLLRFLKNLNKAFQRTGRVLQGDSESVRPGPQPSSITDEVSLDLVLLTHGSPAAVLGFQRRQTEPSLPAMDIGLDILDKTISGLSAVQGQDEALPDGCDIGVLMAWRDMGTLFSKKIDSIEFTMNHRESPKAISFTPTGFTRIQERIQEHIGGPQVNIRTIEGRLLMADFKEHGKRCRVHPSVGDPVLCLFDEEQKEEVLENILHYVRIIGEAKADSATGRITSIKIHDIERLEERENEERDLLPQGTPIPRDFWESTTLDELAQAQNIAPMDNVRALFGTWPGELDDGFEVAIDELRHADLGEIGEVGRR